MAPRLSPAQELLARAEKKYNSSVGWFSSSSTKYEEAGDLFKEAANNFKLERLFKESGDAFVREADCREKGGEKDDAANAYWNAAKAYKQGHPDLAVNALSSTVTLLTKLGRFRQAADREKEIGQIYLQEHSDMRKAADSFLRAAEWYDQEDAKATANSCKKDAADLLADLEDFQPAIRLYEDVAAYSLGSQLTKYNVKEYWLRAGLCALAIPDAVSARRQYENYSRTDVTFPSTREARFLLALLESVEQSDREEFTRNVWEFDQITKLDNWKTKILLKAKQGIQDEPVLR